MKKILVLSLSSFTIATSTANASDGCVFNFREFHSLLNKKSPYYKFIRPEKKDNKKKVVTQLARLKTGEQVVFAGGGCAHVNYSFTYSRLVQTRMIAMNQYIQYAIDTLERTPVVAGYKDVLVTALKDKKKQKNDFNEAGIYPLPCGDAQCELDLSKAKEMKISYSFAL